MKKITFIKILIIGFVLTSCASTIPTSDNVYPTVYFQFLPKAGSNGEKNISISGEGTYTMGGLRDQPFDFEHDVLYLKKDNAYATIIGGNDNRNPAGDKGAVKNATLKMPDSTVIEITNMEEVLIANWSEVIFSTASHTRTFKYTGDRGDVRDGMAIGPKLKPLLQNIDGSGIDDFQFELSVTDYFEHTTTKILVVRITTAPSHIEFGAL